MTQPIDVAYVEIVPETKAFKRVLSKEMDTELKKIEKQATDTSNNISDAFKQAGESINGTFRDVNGRLRDARGRFAKAGEAAGGALTDGLQTATGAARTLSGSLTGIITGFSQLASAGPAGVAIAVLGLGALVTAASVAAAAIQSLGVIAAAALAALPGLIGAAIAGFGILAAALHGVGDAFEEQGKKAKSAGAAGVSNARQIADAQRAILQAQKDLVKAREDELDRIKDIQIQLNRARVSEARAVDDVKNAELELADARRLGSPRAIREAELRLEEANATLLEAKDRTQDLAKEKAKADKNGVNGSEQVLRAQEALIGAQDRLAQTQQRVGAAAASSNEAFNKLSKSAQSFVKALLAAKDALAPLQNAIQEAFFSGTAPLIAPIVDSLLELKPEITAVASAFGGIFRELLTFLGGEEAQNALRSILTGLSSFLTAITPAIGPLLEAFAGLAGQSGEFGDELGGAVADGMMAIADFVKDVDLKQLFKDAKVELDKWLPVIKSLLSITFSLFNIFVRIGNFLLPEVNALLGGLSIAMSGISSVFDTLLPKITAFFTNFGKNATTNINNVKSAIAGIPGVITSLAPRMVQAGKDFLNAFFRGFGIAGAGDFVANFAKSFANTIIRMLNRYVINPINEGVRLIQEGINSIPLFGRVSLPKIPNIPQLEHGGLSTKNTIAEISEGNKTEAVLPLENPRSMRRVGEAISEAGGTSAGMGDVTVIVNLGDEQIVARQVQVVRTMNRKTARSIKQNPRMV